MPEVLGHQVAECSRCERVLAGRAVGRVDLPLAFALSALLLMVPGSMAPLLSVSTFGAVRESWLSSGARALASQGYSSLGAYAFLCSLLLPFLYLGALVWVLASLHFSSRGRAPGPTVGGVYRWVLALRPWMMIEVFLIGAFVAYTRIEVVASVEVGSGGWCLLAATFLLLLALTQVDDRTVWSSIDVPVGDAPRRSNAHRIPAQRPHSQAFHAQPQLACTACDLILSAPEGTRCPRCRAILRRRKPAALRRTAALLLAGYLLYVPANLLPVVTIVRLGHIEENTILSGVLELIRNDLWPLAVIVFVASIVLPLTKLFGLTWMLLAVRLRSVRLLALRTRLFRGIDLIGRWSNIDVFMASVLVALLQFGALTSVRVGPGLVAFAAVVVITMFAVATFDSRLMWDAARRPS